MQELKKRSRLGFQLLERLALDTGHDPGNEPARQAQLDDRD
jgi:hypothetical protein